MELLQIFLVLATSLTRYVTSYPLNNHEVTNTTHSLIRRQCVWIPALQDYDCNEFLPTPQQIAWHMRDVKSDGMVGPDSPLIFYAGLFPGATVLTRQQIQQQGQWFAGWMQWKGFRTATWVGQAMKNTKWLDYSKKYIETGPNKQKFIDKYGSVLAAQTILDQCWIQAFALAPIYEDVYFFTAHNSMPLPTSYWVQAESWVLTRAAGTVKRIWQVDPRPEDLGGTPCAEPTLLWLRGRDPPLPQKWKCPVTYDDGTIPDLPDPWVVPPPPPPAAPPANPPANPPT